MDQQKTLSLFLAILEANHNNVWAIHTIVKAKGTNATREELDAVQKAIDQHQALLKEVGDLIRGKTGGA